MKEHYRINTFLQLNFISTFADHDHGNQIAKFKSVNMSKSTFTITESTRSQHQITAIHFGLFLPSSDDFLKTLFNLKSAKLTV